LISKLLPTRLRNRHLFASDAAALVVAALVAFAVRFEGFDWIGEHLSLVAPYILVTVPVRLTLFYWTGMYRRLWKHASVGELRHIVAVASMAAAVSAVLGIWLLPLLRITPSRISFSVLFIEAFLTGAAIGLPRLLARTMRRRKRSKSGASSRKVTWRNDDRRAGSFSTVHISASVSLIRRSKRRVRSTIAVTLSGAVSGGSWCA